MPWSISQADTRYDAGQHPWDSLFNGLTSNGAFKPSPREQQLMDVARMTTDPATPDAAIRANMTAGPPADAGFAPPQPTIEGVLDGSALQAPHLYDRSPTDFSGTVAGIEASSRNTISIGG